MTDQEARHIADFVGLIKVQVRLGSITPARLDEQLSHIIWLLDHPGWQVNRPINLEEAAA